MELKGFLISWATPAAQVAHGGELFAAAHLASSRRTSRRSRSTTGSRRRSPPRWPPRRRTRPREAGGAAAQADFHLALAGQGPLQQARRQHRVHGRPASPPGPRRPTPRPRRCHGHRAVGATSSARPAWPPPTSAGQSPWYGARALFWARSSGHQNRAARRQAQHQQHRRRGQGVFAGRPGGRPSMGARRGPRRCPGARRAGPPPPPGVSQSSAQKRTCPGSAGACACHGTAPHGRGHEAPGRQKRDCGRCPPPCQAPLFRGLGGQAAMDVGGDSSWPIARGSFVGHDLAVGVGDGQVEDAGWLAISLGRCCRRTSAPKPPRMPVWVAGLEGLDERRAFSSSSWVMYCFSGPGR